MVDRGRLRDEVRVDVDHGVVIRLEHSPLHSSLLLQLEFAFRELVQEDVVIIIQLLEGVPLALQPLIQLILIVCYNYLIFTDPWSKIAAHFF